MHGFHWLVKKQFTHTCLILSLITNTTWSDLDKGYKYDVSTPGKSNTNKCILGTGMHIIISNTSPNQFNYIYRAKNFACGIQFVVF